MKARELKHWWYFERIAWRAQFNQFEKGARTIYWRFLKTIFWMARKKHEQMTNWFTLLIVRNKRKKWEHKFIVYEKWNEEKEKNRARWITVSILKYTVSECAKQGARLTCSNAFLILVHLWFCIHQISWSTNFVILKNLILFCWVIFATYFLYIFHNLERINMDHDSGKTIKKKPSGAEYKRRRIEKEAEALKNAQNITKFFQKGNSEPLIMLFLKWTF